MSSMARKPERQDAALSEERRSVMYEKIYHTMKAVGIWNLVLGIIIIVSGIFTGICIITGGANLLRKKSEILF